MKTLVRLFSLGALVAGVGLVPVQAASSGYGISGYQEPATQETWNVSVPSTLSVSGSVSITPPPGENALGAIVLQRSGSSYQAYKLTHFGSGTVTSSKSGITPGNYVLQLTAYNATAPWGLLSFNISATLTW